MYERALVRTIRSRMQEPRRFLQIVLGPRQVGKTTSVTQALGNVGLTVVRGSADVAGLQTPSWLVGLWEEARRAHVQSGEPVVLFVDEVQKVDDWSAWVKKLWDEDAWHGREVRVVLTGSSPVLMQQGLSESLTGRFEIVRATHWAWTECRDAFGWDLDTFVYYGGYPGSARLLDDPERWRAYVQDTIVETAVSRDILLMTRVDKPALLRRVFALACEYAGQELTYEKMVGQLQDAGNTTTVAHYLDLLDGAGLVTALQKYSPSAVRRRRSSPKLLVNNTAVLSVAENASFETVRANPARWGRYVEAAVGAHLLAIARSSAFSDVYYWRDRVRGRVSEVDFVLRADGDVIGIEVKSSGDAPPPTGLGDFAMSHEGARTLLVGPGGLSLEEFLSSSLVRM